MADNVGYTPGTGATVAADEIAGVLHQRIKLGIGADGVAVDVSAANPLPITTSSPIAVTGGLTDGELRATPVPISASAPLAVTGPLTDAQLRATAVPISGALTDTQLRASPVPISGVVTGPLTDAQLRATPVPISGALTDTQLRATPVPVSGPLTDAQLRALSLEVRDQSSEFILNRMLVLLASPQGYDMSLQRSRQTAVIESGTITTVTTVSSITNIAGLGGIQAQILPNAANLAAWDACCRTKIT